jgi:hypothetical protein
MFIKKEYIMGLALFLLATGQACSNNKPELKVENFKLLCVETMSGRSDMFDLMLLEGNINLKRDFGKIQCSDNHKNKLNLFQTAAYSYQEKMIDAFVRIYNLDINLKDRLGNTIIDWLELRINASQNPGLSKRYRKIKQYLISEYSAKSGAELK